VAKDSKATKKRDREITYAIHRLFWRANFESKYAVALCLLTRVPALVFFHILVPLSIAYGLQAVVDRRFDAVPDYAFQIILLSIGYAIFWGLGGEIISRGGARAGVYIQKTVFANFLDKDYDFYNNTYFGSLGAQATRLREAHNEYNQVTLLVLPKQAVVIIGGIIVVASQSLTLALITLVAMGAVLSFTMIMSTWRLKYRRKVSEINSDIAGKIGDALTQAPAVKSFAAERHEGTRLNSSLRRWERIQYISWVLSVPADAGRAILAAIATAVLLITTAQLYREGTISIAIVALIQLYVIKMITATTDIAEIIKAYEQAMGSSYQAVKTMLIEPTIKDKPTTLKLAKDSNQPIAFENVSFRYQDAAQDAQAIKDFSLTIQPGEKIGLVGYSGSGKTTLTKLMLRFMDVTDGTISVGDRDIRDVAQQALRSRIAYVPQEPLLFHRSIYENIAYGQPSASRKTVMEAAAMAYVDEFVDELPNGYETYVGERGVKLSGGQRQRVAIARAILKDAPILLLDEATSALDSRSEQLIQKALWQLMKDRTALVIAHRLSTINRMDRIVVMDKGRIVQTGTHAELLKDKQGIYAELWAHQSGGYIGVPAQSTEVENDVYTTSVAPAASAVY